MALQPDSRIIIVGAGVFGLSTALHLAQKGYKNIHIFDRQPCNKHGYLFTEGADAASADENEILRASYADRILYQNLAFKAMPEWQKWNDMLASSPPSELPPGLSTDIKLWNNCGYLRLSEHGLEDSEKQTQKNFPPEMKHTQYRITDPQRRADAQREGVKTSLGPEHALDSLLRNGSQVTGTKTADGEHHKADLVIVACGGWTPSLIPQVEDLLETTSGTVLSIRLPKGRQDLWDKYSPERFPVWDYNMGSYVPFQNIGGIHGLPRTPEGVVKIAFRGAKWTNYSKRSEASGKPLSYPKTDVHAVPAEGVARHQSFPRGE